MASAAVLLTLLAMAAYLSYGRQPTLAASSSSDQSAGDGAGAFVNNTLRVAELATKQVNDTQAQLQAASRSADPLELAATDQRLAAEKQQQADQAQVRRAQAEQDAAEAAKLKVTTCTKASEKSAKQQQQEAAARDQQLQAGHDAPAAAPSSSNDVLQLLHARDAEVALLKQHLQTTQMQAASGAAAVAASEARSQRQSSAAQELKSSENALGMESASRLQLQRHLDGERQLRKAAEDTAAQAAKALTAETAKARIALAAQETAVLREVEARDALRRAATAAAHGRPSVVSFLPAPPAWAAQQLADAVRRSIAHARALSPLRLLAEALALLVALCVTAALLPWHWLADDPTDVQQVLEPLLRIASCLLSAGRCTCLRDMCVLHTRACSSGPHTETAGCLYAVLKHPCGARKAVGMHVCCPGVGEAGGVGSAAAARCSPGACGDPGADAVLCRACRRAGGAAEAGAPPPHAHRLPSSSWGTLEYVRS